MEQIKELILVIARALVDDPGQVSVNVIEGGHTLVFELSVSQSDVGKVIGKQGKMADAIRIVLSAVGAKLGKRCNLEIIQ